MGGLQFSLLLSALACGDLALATSRSCPAPDALKKYTVVAQSAAASFERLNQKARSSEEAEARVKQALREGGLVKTVPLTSVAEEVPLPQLLKASGFINLMDCPEIRRDIEAGKTQFIPAGAVVIYKVGEKRETAIRTVQNCNEDSGADTCVPPIKKKYLSIFVK